MDSTTTFVILDKECSSPRCRIHPDYNLILVCINESCPKHLLFACVKCRDFYHSGCEFETTSSYSKTKHQQLINEIDAIKCIDRANMLLKSLDLHKKQLVSLIESVNDTVSKINATTTSRMIKLQNMIEKYNRCKDFILSGGTTDLHHKLLSEISEITTDFKEIDLDFPKLDLNPQVKISSKEMKIIPSSSCDLLIDGSTDVKQSKFMKKVRFLDPDLSSPATDSKIVYSLDGINSDEIEGHNQYLIHNKIFKRRLPIIFTTSCVFKCPSDIKFVVVAIGGGAGGGAGNLAYCGGGGSGFLRSTYVELKKGQEIKIEIGQGGRGLSYTSFVCKTTDSNGTATNLVII